MSKADRLSCISGHFWGIFDFLNPLHRNQKVAWYTSTHINFLKGQEINTFPLLGTTDVLEKIECALSGYLKNIWTEMILPCENPTDVEWYEMIFSNFAVDNIGLHKKKKKGNCDITKKKKKGGFYILELHICSLDSCICLFLFWDAYFWQSVLWFMSIQIFLLSLKDALVYCFGWLLD